jgi:hypothetical protein
MTGGSTMMEWFYHLPVLWMALVIFGATYVVTWRIHRLILRLGVGDRLRVFKGISPGLLSPLGTTFALLVAFIAAQVWSESLRAADAVNREASALRTVVLLAAVFPESVQDQIQGLVRRQILEAATNEWPAMSRRSAALATAPAALAEGLHVILTLNPQGAGQIVAQREMVRSMDDALDARRQRIIISHSGINGVKWLGMAIMAGLTLVAIAMIHSDDRTSAALAMGLFATAVAAAALLIAAHTRPFTGAISVGPDLLLQVMPEGRTPKGF